MTNPTPIDVQVERISRWFENYYRDIEAFGADLATRIHFDTARPGMLTQASRDYVQQRSVEFLNTHQMPSGAGVVFSREAIGSTEGSLEWWVRDPEQGVAKYSFGVNPSTDRFYDYENLEWFQVAFGEGRRAIQGPYIDYLGVEEYQITCVTPLTVDGALVGVVGTDNYMSDVERAVLPLLRELSGDAAVLNPHRNVLVGNSSHFVSGDRVLRDPDGYTSVPLEVRGLELFLLYRV